MTDCNFERRKILQQMSAAAVALPLLAIALPSEAAPALVPLTSQDPQAVALGYTADSASVDPKLNPTHKPDQRCDRCLQFQGKAGQATGGCNIFPGKSVSANGWCRAFVMKPGT